MVATYTIRTAECDKSATGHKMFHQQNCNAYLIPSISESGFTRSAETAQGKRPLKALDVEIVNARTLKRCHRFKGCMFTLTLTVDQRLITSPNE